MSTSLKLIELAAVFAGLVLCLSLIDWLNENTLKKVALEKIYGHWPGWARPFCRWFHLIAPMISRYRFSSPQVRRQLLLIGSTPGFDDQEFARLRLFLCLSAAFLGGLVWMAWGILAADLLDSFSLQKLVDLLGQAFIAALLLAGLVFSLVGLKLQEQARVIERSVSGSLPNFLDVLALALEAGQNFQSALQMSLAQMSDQGASKWLKHHFRGVLNDMRSGESRASSMRKLSGRLNLPEVTQLVASILTADRQGASVAGILRRQAVQLRSARALDAERQATKAPVKLLAPLAICIFPCTFAVLIFPIAVQLKNSGLFA